MTCSEVTNYLSQAVRQGWEELPSKVREHLESCEYCRAVWDFLTGAQPGEEVSPQVRAKIESAIQQKLRPVRPLPSTRLLTFGFLLIFVSMSAVFVGWAGTQGTIGMGWLQFAGMIGVIGAAVFLLSLALSREMAPGEKRIFTPSRLFLLLVPLFAAVALLFPWEYSRNLIPQSWRCFRAGFIFSLPAAGLAVLLLRKGAVLSLGVVGAAAGLLAGLVGVLVLHFDCGVHNAAHVAMGHLSVPLAAAVVGGLMGELLQRFSPRDRSSG